MISREVAVKALEALEFYGEHHGCHCICVHNEGVGYHDEAKDAASLLRAEIEKDKP